ncbi:MAG TPA: protein translocase subunit SecF [Ignavibacteriaceae bacterium]|nr:protein translocase subunit SecF [Ignavibacteriaceae bacterium]
MRIFENLNFDFLGKRKLFYYVSAAMFLVGLINILLRGLNFGIDFKGGSEIVLQFEKTIQIGEIRSLVEGLGIGNVEVKTFGGETGVLLRTELQSIPEELYPKVIQDLNNEINTLAPNINFEVVDSSQTSVTYSFPNADTTSHIIEQLALAGFNVSRVADDPASTQMITSLGIADWIKEELREKMKDNPFQILREDRVGPKIGDELKRDALIAIFFSLIAILIYLGFRFKFVFAVGAVAALFHDVLITVGLYSVLYGVIPGLNLEIDLTVVAAFLTLVGYSINDTVVVFDRVRENMKIHKTMDLQEVINKSINQTMSRTIITGVTTLITVFILMLIGGDVLRAFAFTLFFGIIIGTYSSIFVASAFVLEYATKRKKKVQFS